MRAAVVVAVAVGQRRFLRILRIWDTGATQEATVAETTATTVVRERLLHLEQAVPVEAVPMAMAATPMGLVPAAAAVHLQ